MRHPPADQDESAPPAGQGDLLVQLDPAVREVLERAGRGEPWLLVLDECAPSELRGAVASGVREALGRDTEVVGLGSALPADLPAGRRELAAALLGEVDLHVPLAAAVQDGDVAPYQELLLHCAPTAAEQAWLDGEVARTSALVDALLAGRRGSRPLLDWLSRRLLVRTHLPWTAVERSEPELARAGLRLAAAGRAAAAPRRVAARGAPGAARRRRLGRRARGLRRRPARRLALGRRRCAARGGAGRPARARAGRPAAGARSRRSTGCAPARPRRSPPPSGCSPPSGAALGDDLRALVLCDAGGRAAAAWRRRAARAPPGSALLAVELLAAGPRSAGLRPVLVTNRRVAAAPDVAQELRRFCGRRGAPGLRSVPLSGTGLYELASDRPGLGPPHLDAARDRLPRGGHSRLLVGTPALLGEGWDCPSLAVVVDLGSGPGRGRGPRAGAGAAASTRRARTRPPTCGASSAWPTGTPRGPPTTRAPSRGTPPSLAPRPRPARCVAGIGHCDPALHPARRCPRRARGRPTRARWQRAGAARRAPATPGGSARAAGREAVQLRVRTARDPGLRRPRGARPRPCVRAGC